MRSGKVATARLLLPLAALAAIWSLSSRQSESQIAADAGPPVDPGPRIIYPDDRPAHLAMASGRRQAVASLLNGRRPLGFGDFLWNEDGVPAGPVWIRVDPARQLLSVFRGGHEIGSTVIIFGGDNKQTPSGDFPILAMARMHRSSLYDADMPYMLRLTGDGVAIHASTVQNGFATHGCIGVPMEFARRLFGEVTPGDVVTILPVA